MKTAILLAALLVLGAVAVAPSASAHHCQAIRDPPQACAVVEAALHDVSDYLSCYQSTPWKLWLQECL